ncbi:hypothetical protein JR316_0013033 [Psilocybe cubensis]|uniref:Uncharacterized protein n=2 Tax=Psilocybe cubensis TaxID=181762 RepID=A0A8H7XQ12_PSICU|nr:hypothetical protein JR316_0013033 [Psilocybe cubensis]KAH9474571.1 hypothetical protein JR316_0013033 [Psilocybe cubensis]
MSSTGYQMSTPARSRLSAPALEGGGSDNTCCQHDDNKEKGTEVEAKRDADVESVYIAIEPPASSVTYPEQPPSQPIPPPSFDASQFGIILRHQRLRPPDNSGLKLPPPHATPSRFVHLSNAFEFAGWGSSIRVKLTQREKEVGEERVKVEREEREKGLGQWTASALAGNAVLGSVFYALPAVVGVAGVYSPISLFIAALVLFLWRPIMEELAAALPISGAPYTYILNISTKSLALVTAALLLLDFASTAIVSAATAAAYLAGELGSGDSGLPFPTWVGAVLVLVLFTLVSLWGVRESARIALGVLGVHVLTMLVLAITACVHWASIGTAQLRANWALGGGPGEGRSAGAIAKQVYYGVCLGMLGLTGFECTPSYVSRIKPGRFPRVLRNLHLPSIVLSTTMMLLVLAILPMDVALRGENVLSVLAEVSGGRWLRLWIVVDAVIVLCGGVLTGILAASELLTQLAQHRVLPSFFLLPLRLPFRRPNPLPRLPTPPPSASPITTPVSPISNPTPSSSPSPTPHIAILVFSLFSGALYASALGSLSVISEMFSLVWVCVMGVFPVAGMLLKFERGRLVRGVGVGVELCAVRNSGERMRERGGEDEQVEQGAKRGVGGRRKGGERKTRLLVILAALIVAPLVFAGNVAYNPKTAGYFSAYFIGILLFFSATQNKVHLLRWLYWVYDQYPSLHVWRVTSAWGEGLISLMRRLKRQPVCILVKSDEINSLFHMVMYVRKNEETSCLKIIHFYEEEKEIPSELEANAKILDEAFPEITVDLILVDGKFDPAHIAALSYRLKIPQSLMFMTCPGPTFPYSVAELGTRIISL